MKAISKTTKSMVTGNRSTIQDKLSKDSSKMATKTMGSYLIKIEKRLWKYKLNETPWYSFFIFIDCYRFIAS